MGIALPKSCPFSHAPMWLVADRMKLGRYRLIRMPYELNLRPDLFPDSFCSPDLNNLPGGPL